MFEKGEITITAGDVLRASFDVVREFGSLAIRKLVTEPQNGSEDNLYTDEPVFTDPHAVLEGWIKPNPEAGDLYDSV